VTVAGLVQKIVRGVQVASGRVERFKRKGVGFGV
jgi:hypothetical protein